MNGFEAQAIYDRYQLQVGSVNTAVAEVILKLEAEIGRVAGDLRVTEAHADVLKALLKERNAELEALRAIAEYSDYIFHHLCNGCGRAHRSKLGDLLSAYDRLDSVTVASSVADEIVNDGPGSLFTEIDQ